MKHIIIQYKKTLQVGIANVIKKTNRNQKVWKKGSKGMEKR